MTRLSFLFVALVLPVLASADTPEDRSPEMRRASRAYASQIVRCFGKAHKKKPEARGSITVAFDISDNHATDTWATEDTVGIRSLSRCVERRTGKWFYEGVEDGTYSWRFDFRIGTDDRD